MSYCRCNRKDSDVYVYGSEEHLICCGCDIGKCETKSTKEMILHLIKHVREGQKVPDYAFIRLLDELEKHGDKYII